MTQHNSACRIYCNQFGSIIVSQINIQSLIQDGGTLKVGTGFTRLVHPALNRSTTLESLKRVAPPLVHVVDVPTLGEGLISHFGALNVLLAPEDLVSTIFNTRQLVPDNGVTYFLVNGPDGVARWCRLNEIPRSKEHPLGYFYLDAYPRVVKSVPEEAEPCERDFCLPVGSWFLYKPAFMG